MPYVSLIDKGNGAREIKQMIFEVLYQLRSELFAGHVALTTDSQDEAFAFCRNFSNFPEDTIHYAITCEDGSTLHDTNEDGLLDEAMSEAEIAIERDLMNLRDMEDEYYTRYA